MTSQGWLTTKSPHLSDCSLSSYFHITGKISSPGSMWSCERLQRTASVRTLCRLQTKYIRRSFTKQLSHLVDKGIHSETTLLCFNKSAIFSFCLDVCVLFKAKLNCADAFCKCKTDLPAVLSLALSSVALSGALPLCSFDQCMSIVHGAAKLNLKMSKERLSLKSF